MFLGLIIFYLRLLITDITRYRKHGKFTRDSQTKRASQATPLTSFSSRMSTITHSDSCFGLFEFINKIQAIFELDSGPWIAKEIIKEIVEIATQTSALLFYNAYSQTASDEDDVVLAQDPEFIMLFTGFIASNCILTSTMWLFYAFRPLSCHGLLFHGILYSIDAVFDIFYAMYPLIVVARGNQEDGLTTLASLNTDKGLSVLYDSRLCTMSFVDKLRISANII